MLREYEKAKLTLDNDDLDQTAGGLSNTHKNGDLSMSPYGHFLRSTTGKKLYINKVGELPDPKVHDSTLLSEAR